MPFTEIQRYGLWIDVPILAVLIAAFIFFWTHSSWNAFTRGAFRGTFVEKINKKLLYIVVFVPYTLLTIHFITAKLSTRIDEQGIHYRMFPTQWRETSILLDQVAAARVITQINYGCGGYNTYVIADDYGLSIILSTGKRMIIGTKKPNEMAQAIREYYR